MRFCRRERASKARVASGMDDPRFHEAKFVEAPAIFANNDVKYENNKNRSRLFAEQLRHVVRTRAGHALSRSAPR